jgi:hypothetical protein
MIAVFLFTPAAMSGYRMDEAPTFVAVYVAEGEAAAVAAVPAVAVHGDPLAAAGVQFGMTMPFGLNQPMKRRGTAVLAADARRDQSAEGRNGKTSVTPAEAKNTRRDLLTPMLI